MLWRVTQIAMWTGLMLACSKPPATADAGVGPTSKPPTGTSGGGGGAGAGADAATPEDRPKPQPLNARPLGEAPWTALSATPTRDALLVGMPRALRRVSPDGTKVAWEAPLEAPALFVAASGDGKQVAALVRRPNTAENTLVIVDASGGKPVAAVRFELPSPPDRDRGRQPSTRPMGLYGEPGAAAFLVVNPYGTWRVSAATKDGAEAERVSDNAYTVVAQDGSGVWAPANDGVVRLDGDKRAVDLGCYPQRMVVDPSVDRVGTLCSQKQKLSVRWHVLSSGEKLGEWPVQGWPQMAILGAGDRAELRLLDTHLARRGRLTEDGLRWSAQGGGFASIAISESGETALGRGAGVVQAVDLASGKVRCSLSLGAWGAGLDGDDAAWLLGFAPDVFNKLQIQRADLKTCRLEAAKPLDMGKTTNLGALWLPKPRAFLLNGLYGEGSYGPVLVHVDGRIVPFGGRNTPQLEASPDGRHVALVQSDRAELYAITPEGAPKSLKVAAEAPRAALCDDRALTYMWNKGWTTHPYDPATKAPPRFAPQPQVDSAWCRAGTLVIGRVDDWYVLDATTGRFTGAWIHGHRVGPLALLPDGRSAVLAGGPTGWQLAPLR